MADITKSEGDGNHPCSHYLVCEDEQKPSSWHLRVKGTDGKPDHGLMGAAWAALHSGYRGNKYEGPNKDEAIKKLKGMYDSEKMETPSGASDASDARRGKALEAALGAEGCSLENLRSQVCAKCQEVTQLITPSGAAAAMGSMPNAVWVTDILCPESDDDDWCAIVCAADGKTYEQDFSCDEGVVSLEGDPTEVIREVSYMPAPKEESNGTNATEAADQKKNPAELNAGDLPGHEFRGNQYGEGGGSSTEKEKAAASAEKPAATHPKSDRKPGAYSDDFKKHIKTMSSERQQAYKASEKAYIASASAHTDHPTDAKAVNKAAVAHDNAAYAHKQLAEKYGSSSDPYEKNLAAIHKDAAAEHSQTADRLFSKAHEMELKAGKAGATTLRASVEVTHPGELQGGSAPEARAAAIAATAALESSEKKIGNPLEGALACEAPTSFDGFMVAPAGVHTITLGRLGQPHTITVDINPAGAAAMQQRLEAVNAAGPQRCFNCFDHEKKAASSWPKKFWWEDGKTPGRRAGIYESAEPSKTGLEAVSGKTHRSFSMTFFVDNEFAGPDQPAQIVCPLDAGENPGPYLNMGTLTNKPAFEKNQPLFASNPGGKPVPPSGTRNSAAIPLRSQKESKPMTPEEINALQARNEQLETKINELSAQDTQVAKAELRAARAEIESNQAKIELGKSQAKVTELEAENKKRVTEAAKDAVKVMINNQDIAALDTELQASWQTKFENDPSLIPLVAKPKNGNGGGNGRVSGSALVLEATRQQDIRTSGGFSIPGAMKGLLQILNANARIRVTGNMSKAQKQAAYEEKGKLALEAGLFYKRELSKSVREWDMIPNYELAKCVGLDASSAQRPNARALEAADFVDPNNQLGTLSGTLVLQRTLPLFAYEYPELTAMYTDFSDAPGLFEQTEVTRIVLVPAVQTYDSTKDAAGRPKGWDTISPAITVDAPVTLSEYIAVPIVFGQDILSETTRRVFDEQSAGAIKAIAGFFTGMMSALITPGNFNAYAQVTAPNAQGVQTVPVAYTNYAKSLQDFNMTDLDKLSAIFTQNQVPRGDRGILLSSLYYAKLRSDPRLEFFFAASKGDPVLTQQKLPEGLSGFFPYEAPYLPSTGNLAFFPFHKASIILKSRLPMDFKGALDVMIPGSVTTVTDPDTKISLALVQYVNLTQNYAEWRPEAQLGAGKGDSRGGLCGTTQ